MLIQIDFSDIVALLALGLSLYSMRKTFEFNRRQNEFAEKANRLNTLLLEKERQDALDQKRADISADFIKVGQNERSLTVFNKGRGLARDVRIEFPEGIGVLIPDEVQDKFPIPILEQNQSVELIAAVTFGSSSRMTIKLIWNDESGTDNEKTLTPTIS